MFACDMACDYAPFQVGKVINCSGAASGGVSPYTFEWDSQNDGTVDGTGTTFTFTPLIPGSIPLKLTVTDSTSSNIA